MGKSELRFFYNNVHHYNENSFGDDGSVWEHKSIGFDKSLVKITQLSFNFNQES